MKGKKEQRGIMVGLGNIRDCLWTPDAGGKTTILYKIKKSYQVETIIPVLDSML